MDEETKKFESAKLAYEMAHQLWIYEGNSIWSKFNAMLVTHSIAFAVLADLNKPQYWLIGSLTGFIICVIWAIWMVRGFDTIDFWIGTAKEIESQFLHNSIVNVRRGGSFTLGEKVKFKHDDKVKKKKMNYLSKFSRIRTSAYIVVGLLGMIYLFVFINNISSVCLLCDFCRTK